MKDKWVFPRQTTGQRTWRVLHREILGRGPKVGKKGWGWFQDLERRPDRDRDQIKGGRPCMPCKKLGIYFVEYRKNHLVNDPNIYLLQ